MNVLFLSIERSIENLHQRGIYNDLINELKLHVTNVYIVSPREKRSGLATEYSRQGNVHQLKVKTGNITEVKSIEKGISTLLIEKHYRKAIETHLQDAAFDLILYSTPPITFSNLIASLRTAYRCKSYLILKDIFPQNAVDMNMFGKKNPIYHYFRHVEKRLYNTSDRIGCMSKANVDYMIKHNPETKDKLEIFPNAIKPTEDAQSITVQENILAAYDLPDDKTLFVYGGNLGRPQGIDGLIDVVNSFSENKIPDSHLVIIGDGTEYERLSRHINSYAEKNVTLLNRIPKYEYDQLLRKMNVGLIFLDPNFSIPNFPSRLTAYMDMSLPIIAATDTSTDLKDVLEESGAGFWLENGDTASFVGYANKLSSNAALREEMGKNGREYLENHYNISKEVKKILNFLEDRRPTNV
ncbi:glycosyltransferase family 4 protein [Salisediminibacterium halotolerans]|uniref:glycosyltransferase family 4 protein n=1 Tax=Salisediminibacterium halotolerans TaxID=517425 RepID=UPI000EACB06C|nr:glycosyltransferase family 4 protein [Salisediminibacterium halotolerans]RLJ75703.1 glycosyltransferase involved in cell wall biosynthesis [Actinophytocola xinjiangensis]RPE89557.1 glycosyltransferase involved in cell wall biosynthesis [Salisediminibacterium halotolerans]TWG36316.1 glycosyltransferase involved in cell wall biosynthesis [Salisediminibacterium halotolerans]GEL07236.1 glycosyltransferase WbuB [Salisediminibacterium halotolerans]